MGTVTILHTGTQVEVPDDPDEERAVMAAHPEIQEAFAESRRRRARGERGTPIEQVIADAGVEVEREQAHRGNGGNRRNEPSTEPSGRVVVRFPKTVHRDLAERAAAEGVSLNQLVLMYVSRGLGQDEGAAARPTG